MTYSALKCVYLKKLHEQGIFALDGEVTQLFLREQSQNLPGDIASRIRQFSFKAEQFLGRTGYISFDLGSNGKSIFAVEGEDDVSDLIEQLRLLISDLQSPASENLGSNNTQPKISLAIATYNRPQYLEKCIDSVAKLLIPSATLEIVIVDDGSDQEYDIEALQAKSPFAIKYVKKEHSGICATKNRAIEESTGEFIAFLDDDMVVSPLWLARLMSGFINERIAGVGSTNLTYPDNNALTQYSDYRELARRPFRDQTGEVLNVLTGSACLRKKVLLEVGGFNQRQSAEGVPFGGDDVDITWKIRDAGYKFSHADDSAIAFHNHRSTMKSFIKQHIGYGEGTMFHCIDKDRDPSELGIPEPTLRAVTADIVHYLLHEVPQRVIKCHKDNLGIQKSLTYPALDFTRRFFYDLGILKARKHIKKYEK